MEAANITFSRSLPPGNQTWTEALALETEARAREVDEVRSAVRVNRGGISMLTSFKAVQVRMFHYDGFRGDAAILHMRFWSVFCHTRR